MSSTGTRAATADLALPGMPAGEDAPAAEALPKNPFGEPNRLKLIHAYFNRHEQVPPADAWRHAYRLLLWIDPTTGLAHAYESDKCQPGKAWYPRALAFHDWVCGELGTTPADLANEIDLLFQHATKQLAQVHALNQAKAATKASADREPYENRGFPVPGEDPKLEQLILGTLSEQLQPGPTSQAAARRLAAALREYVRKDNKRKNLLGRGFEDVLSALLERVAGSRVPSEYTWKARCRLHTLPGFRPAAGSPDEEAGQPTRSQAGRARGKRQRPEVDLALVRNADGHRTLVSCKWSFRADREEQFHSEFDRYTRLNTGAPFDYVLVTGELDAARLAEACTARTPDNQQLLFTSVIHVNPEAVVQAYREPNPRAEQLTLLPSPGPRRSPARGTSGIARTRDQIDRGRLSSLASWLESFCKPES